MGELVIYATRFSEHKDSGYQWTRNEIAMKVRMIVAESAGMPLDDSTGDQPARVVSDAYLGR